VNNEIIIHKKRNSPKLTSSNVKQMYEDGSLVFENSSMCTPDIIMLLEADSTIATVHEHSVRDFNNLIKARNVQS